MKRNLGIRACSWGPVTTVLPKSAQIPTTDLLQQICKSLILRSLNASGGARNPNLLLRRPTLYPVELRMRQIWTIGLVGKDVNRRTRLRLARNSKSSVAGRAA